MTRHSSCAFLLLHAALATFSQEVAVPLSSDQVACDQRQLAGVLERMELLFEGGPVRGTSGLPTILASFGFGDVLVRGTEVRAELTSHFPPIRALSGDSDCLSDTERVMGFQLAVQPEQFLLNPERQPLDQFLLARIEPQSNPTSIRCTLPDTHLLRLGLGPTSDPFSSVLEINNVIQVPAGQPSQGAIPAASGASRNLRAAGLVERCHDALTAWDRRSFALLERMARSFSFFVADETVFYHDQEVAIFRGTDPHTYRVDAYSIGKDPATGRGVAVGRNSYEVVIGWDAQGRWTTGSVRLLPRCTEGQTLDCSTHEGPAWLWIFPPFLPDFGLRGDPPNAVFVGQGLPGIPSSASVDWADLLADSVWNRGIGSRAN